MFKSNDSRLLHGQVNTAATERRAPFTKREIGATLLHEMLDAVSLNEEAAQQFDRAVSQACIGVYRQNGTPHIKDASKRLDEARKGMMTAHHQLSSYIESGIVPEDLRRSG